MGTKLGIVMAAYNAEKWIAEAIESIVNQSLTSWVLQIVDDGSTDYTIEAARQYFDGDDRVQLVSIEHGGCPVAKAKAVELLLADQDVELISLLDSDDTCSPDRLEKQIMHLENTGVDISFTTYGWMDVDGRYMRSMAPRKANASALCNRGWYEKIGGWDKDGWWAESDGRTLQKMYDLGATFDILQEELYQQRRRCDQVSLMKRRG